MHQSTSTRWPLLRHRSLIRHAAHLLNRPQLRHLHLSPQNHATSHHKAPSLTLSHAHHSPLPSLYPISPFSKPTSTPTRHPTVPSPTSAAVLVYWVFAGTMPLPWWPSLSTVALTFALPVTCLLSSTSRIYHPCQSWWPLRVTLSPQMIDALNAVTPL
jgi:hypothetical protein